MAREEIEAYMDSEDKKIEDIKTILRKAGDKLFAIERTDENTLHRFFSPTVHTLTFNFSGKITPM